MTKQDREQFERVCADLQSLTLEQRALRLQIEMLLELHGMEPQTEALARQIAVESKVKDVLRRVDRGYSQKRRA